MFFVRCFFVAFIFIGLPTEPYAQGMGGFFNNSNKAFKVSLKVVQCQAENMLPEDLPGLPEAEHHSACGSFRALTIVDTEFSLLPGQKKTWEKINPVPVHKHVFNAVLDNDKFILEKQSLSEKSLKSGYEMDVYIPKADENSADISMWVKYYTLTTTDHEEMLLHSEGDVHLNPHARQIERLSVFNGTLRVGEETILGGESVLRAPAPDNIPQIYPEDGRLWVEVKLER